MHHSVIALVLVLGMCRAAFAQLPTNVATGTITVRTSLIATASGPTLDMAVRPGETDRLFVVLKGGMINVLQNGAFLPQPYLNIASGFGLINGSETGLLGMAFHPQFSAPGAPGFGKFYTYTSEQKASNAADFFLPSTGPTGGSHHNVVREWSVDPAADTVASTASRVLFRTANPRSNHNGGAVKFGPDGMLYLSLGDGGSPSINAQDTSLIFGKILRIDPTAANPPNGKYGIPAGNPFAAAGDPGLDEIYAYGLRNPFRMAFDRMTGQLYLGDVGSIAREEVDSIILGGNYGWPYIEGTVMGSTPPPGLTLISPLAEYNRTWGASVIGGFVYRGSEIPELVGKYVFADAFSGTLRYMETTGGQIYSLALGPGSSALGGGVFGWGEDSTGELYALISTGRVIRFAAVPEPAAPAIVLLFAGTAARRRVGTRQPGI